MAPANTSTWCSPDLPQIHSDSFERPRVKAAQPALATTQGATPEEPTEYKAENVFWVPAGPLGSCGPCQTGHDGKLVDDAMVAIERDTTPQGGAAKDTPELAVDKQRLGELNPTVNRQRSNSPAAKARACLRRACFRGSAGRCTKYFLTRFASAEGRTAASSTRPVVCALLVGRCWKCPTRARIYDPAAGSGGMFVAERKFVTSHGAGWATFSSTARRANAPPGRLAVMKPGPARHRGPTSPRACRSFARHSSRLRADYVIANPPFTIDWFARTTNVRWQYGVPRRLQRQLRLVQTSPPPGAAAWRLRARQRQHELHPERRRRDPPRLIEAGSGRLAMVARPASSFTAPRFRCGLWFLTKSKVADGIEASAIRRGHTLFSSMPPKLGA